MSLENLSYLAEIIGVVLIIASLIYVARQLQQNTDMLRSQARQAALESELDALSSLIDYPIDVDNPDLELLSPTDRLRFRFILIKSLRVREFSWLQYKNGILDEATWQSYMAPTQAVFASQAAREVFDGYTGDPKFKAYLGDWLERKG